MRTAFFAAILAASASIALAASPALADVMTPEQLKADVVGSTIGGGMQGGSRFTEYYAVDGEIRGLDGEARPYKGKWTVEPPGMCFRYEGVPDSCFEMRRTGNVIEFYTAEGTFAGVGTLQPGNPQGLR